MPVSKSDLTSVGPRRAWVAWLALAAIASLSACRKPKPGPPVAEPRAYLHEVISSEPKNCFERELAYCLKDPTLIDAAIDKAARGKALPNDRRKLDRLAKSAAMSYRLAMMKTEERRQAVHALMVERFNHPTVKARGQMVVVDVGVVPSGIVKGARTGYTLSSHSDLLERSRGLSSAVFAKIVLEALKDHPAAKAVAVDARAKTGSGAPLKQRIIYLVGYGIETRSPLHHWISKEAPAADLSEYLQGRASIYKDRMSCTGESPPDRCTGGPERNFDWAERQETKGRQR